MVLCRWYRRNGSCVHPVLLCMVLAFSVHGIHFSVHVFMDLDCYKARVHRSQFSVCEISRLFVARNLLKGSASSFEPSWFSRTGYRCCGRSLVDRSANPTDSRTRESLYRTARQQCSLERLDESLYDLQIISQV